MQVMYPTSSRPSRPNGTFKGSTGESKVPLLRAKVGKPPVQVNQISNQDLSRGDDLDQQAIRIAERGHPGRFGSFDSCACFFQFLQGGGKIESGGGNTVIIHARLCSGWGLEEADARFPGLEPGPGVVGLGRGAEDLRIE